MRLEEYKRLQEEINDPYDLWIREREIKRPPEEFAIPPEYELFSDPDGAVDEKAGGAFAFYGAFSKGYDFIYTDEDEKDGSGKRHDPYFKPDYSPDTLDSFYYPGGLTLIKKSLSDSVKNETGYVYGSPEFLRECGKKAEKVLHIPEVLYHALSHHDYAYNDRGEDGSTEDAGKVSAVILSKDHPELLEQCVKGLKKSSEKEGIILECLVLDNGSNPENTAAYQRLSYEYSFKYFRKERPFVYSALCNEGAAMAAGEFLLFLNDDIEIPDGTLFLKGMLKEAGKPGTGAVGCKLLYPGGEKIQHCGITLLKSGASHKLSGYVDDKLYYRGINRIKINSLAVTGACLMVEKKKFDRVRGFDEELAVAYTDVDLCSALIDKGFYNVCLNDISLIHHESLSRKADASDGEKYERLKKERGYYYDKYKSLIGNGDPWYNVNLTETGLDFGVNIQRLSDRVPYYEELKKADLKETGNLVRINGDDIILKKPAKEGKVLYSVDVCERRASDENCREDFTEISGWAFVHGSPGYKYDTAILIKDGGEYLYAETGRMERKDILSVFPGEKDIGLSGFSVKIKNDVVKKEIRKEDIILILKTKGFFGRTKGFITI